MHIHTKEMTTRVVPGACTRCLFSASCVYVRKSKRFCTHTHAQFLHRIHTYVTQSYNHTETHTHTSTQREITEIRKRENNVDRTACGSAHVNDTYAQRGSSSPPPFPQIIHTMYNLLSRLALRPKICTVESILRRTPRVYVCVCVCICAYAGTHARVNSKQLVGRSRAC